MMSRTQPARCGILYIALGRDSLREACLSMRSVRRFHDWPAHLFTDVDVPARCRHLFRQIDRLPPEQYQVNGNPVLARVLRARVNCLGRSTFDLTLHLDADTKILQPIDRVWEHLASADLAIANEPLNDWPDRPHVVLEYKNPRYFNAGVFAYRNSDAWRMFLAEWCRRLDLIPDDQLVHETGGDQTPLNQMIFADGFAAGINLRIEVLDNIQYNARGVLFRKLRQDGLWNQVRIAHCHSLHAPWWRMMQLKLKGLGTRLGLVGRS